MKVWKCESLEVWKWRIKLMRIISDFTLTYISYFILDFTHTKITFQDFGMGSRSFFVFRSRLNRFANTSR